MWKVSTTTELSSILKSLENKLNERLSKWTVKAEDFPNLFQVREGAIVGDFSMSLLKSRVRLILPSVAIKPFGTYQSPTELVRDYITAKYKLPLPIRRSNVAAVANPRPAPLFARTGQHGEGTYIDLKSAYWQIVKAVGWNLEYYPRRWIAAGDSMADLPDFIRESKPARASLVSCARPGYISIWNGKTIEYKRSYNTMLNARLVCFTMDVLNGVAADVLAACPSCSYINTDGYIVSVGEARTAYDVLRSWGLVYGVKGTGDVEVSGVGAYRVGKHKSNRPGNGISFSNIDFDFSDWLRPRFFKFAQMQSPMA